RERPFRAPHHTSSVAAMTGGGGKPKPGEISLAHCGILFLDELPEFRRSVLEVLRQPLEDRTITLARAFATVEYPASILLIAAMNPCPCGHLGDPVKRCSCSEYQIRQYRSRISGPLLDRIDMKIDVFPPAYDAFGWDRIKQTPESNSSAMKTEVLKARDIQNRRYRKEPILWNSQLTPELIKRHCRPDKAGEEILKHADARYCFSARAHHKILRLSRTIADLDGAEAITERHIAEAIGYRCPEAKDNNAPKGTTHGNS
ncbi:MAG: magnesium chelatase, partial [Firmicutes bacterium HGW-Firmicutes-11]